MTNIGVSQHAQHDEPRPETNVTGKGFAILAQAQDASQSSGDGGRQCLVELKNGKVILKQKHVSFEKQSETLQEIVKFRDFIQSRVEGNEPPLSEIPDEHKPLIAKLAHESDKTLATLTKYVRQELLPTQIENISETSSAIGDALPHNAVEAAIKSIMNRNNYGLNSPNGGKVPAAVCLWRWEVKHQFWDWLPKNGREKAEQRLAERVRAKEDLQTIFGSLSQDEQHAILDPKANKTQAKITNEGLPSSSSPLKAGKDIQGPPTTLQDEANRAKNGRLKEVPDPEKLAKEKERLDKKSEKADKERRQKDSQDKSRSIMANFFSKKASAAKTSTRDVNKYTPTSSETQSEFCRTFKPFLVKKDSQLAPVNWFSDSKATSKGKFVPRIPRVITIDDDDDDVMDDIVPVSPPPSTLNVSTMDAKERLRSILLSLPPPVDQSRTMPPSKEGTTHRPASIREVMSQLAEAEVAGDDGLVRSLLVRLRDRTLFPIKVLIFDEDARPGYFGTWTRSSKTIGARTPLAQDLTGIDYSYDSGEEWEDEGVADADDVLDDDEEEPGDDETDSDLESWLVDDDADADDKASPDDDGARLPELPEPSSKSSKRKGESEGTKGGKRRKVVLPLIPFTKGPCWESRIGRCEYEPFKTFNLILFNDTPFPVDPFTFVSVNIEDQRSTHHDGLQCTSNQSASLPSKRQGVASKNVFPDTHLPLLLTKITTLEAASITFLVETIYQELRVHKVKKNAIEAKVREVGEKCKERRIWVVKAALEAHQ